MVPPGATSFGRGSGIGSAEERRGEVMFDYVRTGQLDRQLRPGHQAKRWNRRFPIYGHGFALPGLGILIVVGLFAIA
jgi:hypothetical protein